MRYSAFVVSLAAVASAANNKRQFSLPVEDKTTVIDGTTFTHNPFSSFTSGMVPSPTSGGNTPTTTPEETSTPAPTSTSTDDDNDDDSESTTTIVSTGDDGVVVTSTRTEDAPPEETNTDDAGATTTTGSDDLAAMQTPFAGAVGLIAAVGMAMAL
ncbi:hypothetical protein ACRE_033720 [Hapsidospora chrysogenum ATCC 11550]|uniref:Uncharacterized protein n=1 Tax=Hapsidospora chrysogenum (strain ATCC 11550 / CBS 779.69 / DSM 880 / IAM 14645 / JCM 23072 / IMI 49137) TaxID=857340 RepID=A0A086T8Y0_HAPC1|nr:hypothetical protein ACRE_033720 [Hapsidospora chrysogenum ATCC 11550]